MEGEYGPQGLFEWKQTRYFPVEKFPFDATNAGIVDAVFELDESCTESDCFKSLFDSDLVDHIVTETNRYNQQVKATINVKPNSKIHK